MQHIIQPEPPSPTTEQIAALLRRIGWTFSAWAVQHNARDAGDARVNECRLREQIVALKRRIAELSPPPPVDPDCGVRFTGD